jgi:cytochrome P450 monooxygenase
MKAHGCQEPPKYPHKDPFFGIDLLMDNMTKRKQLKYLDSMKTRWQQHGQTFSAKVMSAKAIYTVDVRNLQTVHGTSFGNFGVQPLRRDATLPLLGEGVFTMDGPFWENSRALIRPTFARSNVASLPAFEIHLQIFFDLLPRDGSRIDLNPLLNKLVRLSTTLA